jgi:hypothetical protein
MIFGVTRFPLGVVNAVFGTLGLTVAESARRSADLGFAFIDLGANDDEGDEPLALPVRERFVPVPRAGYTTPMMRPPVTWDEAVTAYRSAPGCRMEPTTFGILQSVSDVRAFVADVPGLRITLDTGHVAAWGDDPCELVDLADSVQLRQATKGVPQVRATEGKVDFAVFFDCLERAGYRDGVSIEYFDLPYLGMPLDDPFGYALELAQHVRPLL